MSEHVWVFGGEAVDHDGEAWFCRFCPAKKIVPHFNGFMSLVIGAHTCPGEDHFARAFPGERRPE